MERLADIVFVFGKICSGKNFFCQKHSPPYRHIVTSDIVKQLIKSTDRRDLSDTKSLDESITEHLWEQICNGEKKVMIDGIRQLSIIQILLRKIEGHYTFIWLEVPNEELKRRYIQRAHLKDREQSFETAILRDNILGLQELEQWIKVHPNTLIYNHY